MSNKIHEKPYSQTITARPAGYMYLFGAVNYAGKYRYLFKNKREKQADNLFTKNTS